MDWFPLLNSLRIAALSSLLVFFLGIAAAYYIAKLPPTAKGVLDAVLTLPLVLPPTVVGYLLLLALGPRRPLGALLLSAWGVRLVMQWQAAVLAVSVVVFPLMYRTARGALEGWRIRLPCCKHGILAGAVLAFARALGEYGATSMVAGYIPGRTATISTEVYQLWRTGEDGPALRWVLVNLLISAAVLLAINLLERRERRR